MEREGVYHGIAGIAAEPGHRRLLDLCRLPGRRRSGRQQHRKWLVFVPAGRIDWWWEQIRLGTEQGRLGISAKAATARVSELAVSPRMKLICLYTRNWRDRDDVRRVLRQLRDLGVSPACTAPAPPPMSASREAWNSMAALAHCRYRPAMGASSRACIASASGRDRARLYRSLPSTATSPPRWQSQSVLFTYADGRPIRPEYLTHRFRKRVRDLGLPLSGYMIFVMARRRWRWPRTLT